MSFLLLSLRVNLPNPGPCVQRDEAAHTNARQNLVKMNNLLGIYAQEFGSFVHTLSGIANGKLHCFSTNLHPSYVL